MTEARVKPEGTTLYQRTISFEHINGDVAEVVRAVWSVTPFMTDCFSSEIDNG